MWLSVRQCEGLVDCVLHFIRSALKGHNTETQAVEDAVCIMHQLSVHITTRKTGCELLYQPDAVSCYVSLLQQSHNPVVLESATSIIYTLASRDTEWSALAGVVVAHSGGLPCLLKQLRSHRRLLAFTSVNAVRVLARNDPNSQRLIGGTRGRW
uniref:Catenin delta-1-like n=1 Tax=Petromyzon marinus TaxID=7757 RepID=A0AAJ7SKJ2_PETMA|nr:catenin delta-1-like [Petromyzon marinus]